MRNREEGLGFTRMALAMLATLGLASACRTTAASRRRDTSLTV